jgi:hypothetical protein
VSDVTEEVAPVDDTATPVPPPPRRVRPRPAGHQSHAPQIIGAALAAVGVAIVLVVPLGWRAPLTVAACAYGVFVAVLAASEFTLARANRGAEGPALDLTTAEQ